MAAPALPAPSAAASTGDATQLLALLNGERSSHGLAPLRPEATLAAGAARHADEMHAGDRLFHTSMVDSAPAGWQRLGENVGRAASATAVHAALMASPPHRANVLEPSFDYVGIGVAGGAGRVVASFKFADHPAAELPAPATEAAGRWATAAGVVATAGGASHHGDLRGHHLAGAVVGLEPTPSGDGYWLVAADGGVFAFGDAGFHGSTGGQRLGSPVVGMTATPTGAGYWLATARGRVHAFGDAVHRGSAEGRLRSPIVRINAKADGAGYALYGADGTRHAFGSAR
jgi:hypothetical protein